MRMYQEAIDKLTLWLYNQSIDNTIISAYLGFFAKKCSCQNFLNHLEKLRLNSLNVCFLSSLVQ
jgi:hypothetical protein